MHKVSPSRTILSSPKGLSLLETLIAIIILALALTSISYFFSTARANIEASGRMRCGLALAQGKMEELRDLGYFHSDLYVDPDLGVATYSDQVDTDSERPGPEVYRKWIVKAEYDPADGTGAGDMDYKLVELRVYDQRLSPAEALDDQNKLVAELNTYISP